MKRTHQLIRAALIVLGVTTGSWADLSNTAALTYRDTLNNPYNGTSNTVVVAVVQAPNITLVKSASPLSVTSGQQTTFSIVYHNTGGGSASNVVITDTIPTGSTLVAGSITGTGSSVTGSVITWTIGNVAAGATGTVTFKVTAN